MHDEVSCERVLKTLSGKDVVFIIGRVRSGDVHFFSTKFVLLHSKNFKSGVRKFFFFLYYMAQDQEGVYKVG